MGFLEKEITRKTDIPVSPGDLLVFYSDGIIEFCSPKGDLFGIKSLAVFVEDHHAMASKALLETLDQTLTPLPIPGSCMMILPLHCH